MILKGHVKEGKSKRLLRFLSVIFLLTKSIKHALMEKKNTTLIYAIKANF